MAKLVKYFFIFILLLFACKKETNNTEYNQIDINFYVIDFYSYGNMILRDTANIIPQQNHLGVYCYKSISEQYINIKADSFKIIKVLSY